jgi:hypothetical protein
MRLWLVRWWGWNSAGSLQETGSFPTTSSSESGSGAKRSPLRVWETLLQRWPGPDHNKRICIQSLRVWTLPCRQRNSHGKEKCKSGMILTCFLRSSHMPALGMGGMGKGNWRWSNQWSVSTSIVNVHEFSWNPYSEHGSIAMIEG